MEPIQKSDASHTIRVYKLLSNTFKTGAELRHFFKISNDFYYSTPQLNSTFFLVKPVSGEASSLNLAMNFL